MSAFRLFDYRLFCVACTANLDVRACNEEDAEREARKKGWFLAYEGLLCPLCLDRYRRANLSTHTPKETPDDDDSVDRSRDDGATAAHHHQQ